MRVRSADTRTCRFSVVLRRQCRVKRQSWRCVTRSHRPSTASRGKCVAWFVVRRFAVPYDSMSQAAEARKQLERAAARRRAAAVCAFVYPCMCGNTRLLGVQTHAVTVSAVPLAPVGAIASLSTPAAAAPSVVVVVVPLCSLGVPCRVVYIGSRRRQRCCGCCCEYVGCRGGIQWPRSVVVVADCAVTCSPRGLSVPAIVAFSSGCGGRCAPCRWWEANVT